MFFSRNSEIYGENEPAEYLYKVISGTVRTYKVLADGRRQIGSFYLAGDLFGLESGDEHSFSAEAITACKVLVIKRSALLALAARDNDVAQQLWTSTGRELRRVQEHILLLIKTAQERVVGFLLEMADRVQMGNSVELPSRAKTLPIISASPSRRCRAPSRTWRRRLRLSCRRHAGSCCGIARR